MIFEIVQDLKSPISTHSIWSISGSNCNTQIWFSFVKSSPQRHSAIPVQYSTLLLVFVAFFLKFHVYIWLLYSYILFKSTHFSTFCTALVFVYDLHAGAETLMRTHFSPASATPTTVRNYFLLIYKISLQKEDYISN